MRTLAVPVIILALLASCGAPEATPVPAPVLDSLPAPTPAARPMDRFQALIGDWVDSTASPKFRSYEQWKSAGDSMLLGFGYVLKGRDTVFFEDLKLEVRDGQAIYSARIDSQNNGDWVPFTALPGGPDSLVFENPGHDWPQCITYTRTSGGGDWQVVVSGTEGGKQRQEGFHYQRR